MNKASLFRRDGRLFRVLFAPCYFVCFCFLFVCKFPAFIKQVRETRKVFRQASERLRNKRERDG